MKTGKVFYNSENGFIIDNETNKDVHLLIKINNDEVSFEIEKVKGPNAVDVKLAR